MEGVKKSLNGIGNIYIEKNKFDLSLDYYKRGLKISDELGDNSQIDRILNNIGTVYFEQANYDLALEYYIKSLKISQDNQEISLMEISLDNIGQIYLIKGKYGEALNYLKKAYKIRKAFGYKNHRLWSTLNNIGYLYYKLGDYFNLAEKIKLNLR